MKPDFFSLLLLFYNNTAAQFALEACKTLCTLNGKIMTEFHSNFYKVAPHSFWAVNCKHFETEIREIITRTETNNHFARHFPVQENKKE